MLEMRLIKMYWKQKNSFKDNSLNIRSRFMQYSNLSKHDDDYDVSVQHNLNIELSFTLFT